MAIDTGIHALGWTRDQALGYLHSQLPIDAAGATLAVDRIIALPERRCMRHGLADHPGPARGRRAELGGAFRPARVSLGAAERRRHALDLLDAKVNRWLKSSQ